MKELINQNLIFIIVGFVSVILGIIIDKFKFHSFIAGYNTLSPSERSKVNIELVAKTLRNGLLIFGVAWIILPILVDKFNLHELLKASLLLIVTFGVIIFLLRVFNKNPKYKVMSED